MVVGEQEGMDRVTRSGNNDRGKLPQQLFGYNIRKSVISCPRAQCG